MSHFLLEFWDMLSTLTMCNLHSTVSTLWTHGQSLLPSVTMNVV